MMQYFREYPFLIYADNLLSSNCMSSLNFIYRTVNVRIFSVIMSRASPASFSLSVFVLALLDVFMRRFQCNYREQSGCPVFVLGLFSLKDMPSGYQEQYGTND